MKRSPPFVAMLLSVLLPAVAHALVVCAAKDRTSGLPRNGAPLRLRSACKPSETEVSPFIGTAQETVIMNHEARIAALEPPTLCPPDAVLTGGACIDKFEASLWDIPVGQTEVIEKVKDGTVTLADLQAAGATLVDVIPVDEEPLATIYATSIAGVLPGAQVTAESAWTLCQRSGKRLPSRDEWLAAAAGTPNNPDDGATECRTGGSSGGEAVPTGSRSSCVSAQGIFDAVGNIGEWTDGRWLPAVRGGGWLGAPEGILTVEQLVPSETDGDIGFRCAR